MKKIIRLTILLFIPIIMSVTRVHPFIPRQSLALGQLMSVGKINSDINDTKQKANAFLESARTSVDQAEKQGTTMTLEIREKIDDNVKHAEEQLKHYEHIGEQLKKLKQKRETKKFAQMIRHFEENLPGDLTKKISDLKERLKKFAIVTPQ
jgi:hypothetical protein